MYDRTQLQILLTEVVAAVLAVEGGEIGPETHLVDDLDMESVEAVEVIQELERRLGIRIDVRKAMALRRISELVDLIHDTLSSIRA